MTPERLQQIKDVDAAREDQGEWVDGTHTVLTDRSIIKPIMFGNRVGKLPECEGSHAYFRTPGNAAFIALASTAIPELVAEVEKRDRLIVDMEIQRDNLRKYVRDLEAENARLREAERYPRRGCSVVCTPNPEEDLCPW